MLNVNYQSALVRALTGSLDQENFTLLDVGASGGISPIWNQFGQSLQAHGFDPLVAEVDRLNAMETSGRVRYHAAFITCSDPRILDGAKSADLPNTMSFNRTSAVRAAQATKNDYVREQFNRGAPVQYSHSHITIDEFYTDNNLKNVDFIKIDTDGYDYYVLHGASETLSNHGVLGVQIECQLHGTSHPYANTFANIDRFMREHGFALFDLNVWRYTRAALPGQFYYDIPAQTVNGQVQWCDALYMLDPITRPSLFAELDTSRFIKLLQLYDIFGLPDCAAELLEEMQKMKINLPGPHSYTDLLNMLAPTGNHAAYVAEFDRDPSTFYPSRQRRPGGTNPPAINKPSIRNILGQLLRRISPA